MAVLYVIDGVPMYNKSFGGSGGTMTKMVGSESAADINSDDIESVNMLTGPSAAALYGSDAANGVIIINTKKGSAEKTTVTINNSTTFSTVYMMPQMQSRYGRSDGYMNWGEQLPSDYNYDPRKFFDTGSDVITLFRFLRGIRKVRHMYLLLLPIQRVLFLKVLTTVIISRRAIHLNLLTIS